MVETKQNTQKNHKKVSFHSRWFANMDKGVLTNADMRRPRYVALYIFFVLFMIIHAVIVLAPCIWMFLTGFKEPAEIYQVSTSFFPKHFDFSKVVTIWKQMDFLKYYTNTFIMAIGAVAVDVVVCGLAGYVLSRLKPKGSGVIHGIIFCLMLLPSSMRQVPLYKMFLNFPIGHFNMLNTFFPIWIMTGATLFDIILFKTAFDNISNSLVEAAKIDGASNMRVFLQIMVPLSMPVIVTASIFAFNFHFGSFFWPMLTLRDSKMSVMGLMVYNLKNSTMTMDYRMLAMFFAIIPQLLIFVIFQKYIMGGVNVGGVKG